MNEKPGQAIWLRRDGDKVRVLLEVDSEWITVIEENWDSPFSHIVEPAGIKIKINSADSIAREGEV